MTDSQEIRKLEAKIWGEEVVNKYDAPMLVRFGYSYIAKDKGKIVGAIVAYPTKQKEVYVCDLVVDKNYRREKIGERLYKRLILATRGRNIVSFIDPGNKASINLHLRLGAKIVRKVKNPYALREGIRLFVRLVN